MARVEFTKPFDDDTRRQVDLLVSDGDWTRVVALIEELLVVRERLAAFPALGRELLAGERETLRRIALAKAPYFIWYLHDPDAEVVRFARLFHARQHTPKPGLP